MQVQDLPQERNYTASAQELAELLGMRPGEYVVSARLSHANTGDVVVFKTVQGDEPSEVRE